VLKNASGAPPLRPSCAEFSAEQPGRFHIETERASSFRRPGTSFASGATVTVDGVPATAVSVTNSTTITATTPPHGAGNADVIVTVEGQQSAAHAGDVFTYTAGPFITNVQASPQKKSASITWTTDVPADGQVEFGTTASYGSRSTLNTTLVINHSVGLSGLLRGTTCHYRVYSRNSAGQLAISGDFTFTTR
jgi:hypothetical protein